jgi:hypothetical protein
MWVVASLLFGANLAIYGVTEVIRIATYIQGALLVITGVGWPVQTIENLVEYVSNIKELLLNIKRIITVHQVFQFSKPKLGVTDGLEEIAQVTKRIIPQNEKDEYIVQQLNDLVVVSATIKYHGMGGGEAPKDLTEAFHPDNISAKEENEESDWRECIPVRSTKEENVFGLNGGAEHIHVLEAETLETEETEETAIA